MTMNRVLAHVQRAGDLLFALPGEEQVKHFLLPFGDFLTKMLVHGDRISTCRLIPKPIVRSST